MSSVLIFLLLISQVNPMQEYTAKRGDIISITVWERPSLSGTVVVDSNGNITLPMPIGAVTVAGMTATEISKVLTDRVKEYVVNPTIFVSITPSEGFTVHVLGEVKSPDFIKVPEGTTVQEVITKAGGFTEFSDKEHIRLIRKIDDVKEGKTIETIVDLTNFIKNGDLSSNPILKSGDTLIIPRMPEKVMTSKRITVYGAVGRPGIIETEEPQPLATIIAMAGGLSSRSNPAEISIIRISDNNILQKTVNFEDFISGKNFQANPTVSFGDMVFVPEKIEEKPFDINVMGQVVRPGTYPATKESRLLNAIYQAGGFSENSDVENVMLIRNEDSSLIKKKVNVKEFIVSGNQEFNPLLMKGDTIYVPLSSKAKQIPSFHEIFLTSMQVSIIGEINKPDTYNVFDNASVLDIIKLAGGPTSSADLKKVTIIRRSDEKGNSESFQSLNLQKVLTKGQFESLPKLVTGDTIFIPRKEERTFWGTIVRTSSEISTIILTFHLITGRRWY